MSDDVTTTDGAKPRTLDELHAEISECNRVLADVDVSPIAKAEACERQAELWRDVYLGSWEIQPRAAARLLISAAFDARAEALSSARYWRDRAARTTASANPVPV